MFDQENWDKDFLSENSGGRWNHKTLPLILIQRWPWDMSALLFVNGVQHELGKSYFYLDELLYVYKNKIAELASSLV